MEADNYTMPINPTASELKAELERVIARLPDPEPKKTYGKEAKAICAYLTEKEQAALCEQVLSGMPAEKACRCEQYHTDSGFDKV